MNEHNGHRDRLRQFFLAHGMDAMRDHEVLELLLFYAVPRRDTNKIARDLLKHFTTLSAVFDAPVEELKKVSGIGDNAAVLIKMLTPLSRRYMQSKSTQGVTLSSSKATGLYMIPYFFGETDELVYLLCLDAKNKLIACRLLQRGSLNSVQLPIRKAAEIAMACKASSVILAHNHPSGLALPSASDYSATDLLKHAMDPLDIRVADHIIVANDDYISLLDSGYLSNP